MNDCPVEPSIPIFLIVGGSFSVLKYILNLGTGKLILFHVDIDQAHMSRYLRSVKNSYNTKKLKKTLDSFSK